MGNEAEAPPDAKESRRRRLFWWAYGIYAAGVIGLLVLPKILGPWRAARPRWAALSDVWLLPGLLLFSVVVLVRGLHEGPFPRPLPDLLIALGCLGAPLLAAWAFKTVPRPKPTERDERSRRRRVAYLAYSALVTAANLVVLILFMTAGRDSDGPLESLEGWWMGMLLPGLLLSSALHGVVFEGILCELMEFTAARCLEIFVPVFHIAVPILNALCYLPLPPAAWGMVRGVRTLLRAKVPRP